MNRKQLLEFLEEKFHKRKRRESGPFSQAQFPPGWRLDIQYDSPVPNKRSNRHKPLAMEVNVDNNEVTSKTILPLSERIDIIKFNYLGEEFDILEDTVDLLAAIGLSGEEETLENIRTLLIKYHKALESAELDNDNLRKKLDSKNDNKGSTKKTEDPHVLEPYPDEPIPHQFATSFTGDKYFIEANESSAFKASDVQRVRGGSRKSKSSDAGTGSIS